MEKKCKTCGETFSISIQELKIMTERKMPEPQHCRKCRRERYLDKKLAELRKAVGRIEKLLGGKNDKPEIQKKQEKGILDQATA